MYSDDDKPIRFNRHQNSRRGGTSPLAKLLAMILVVSVFVISAGLIAVSNELAILREDKWVVFWFTASFAILMIDLAQSFVLGHPMLCSSSWPNFRKARLTFLTLWIVFGTAAIVWACLE